MLNDYTDARNQSVGLLFFIGQLLAPGLLFRLDRYDTRWFIALVAGIFVQYTALRKGWLLFITNLFVMLLSLARAAEVFHPASVHIDDNVVLYGMCFLFSAVVLLLFFIFLGGARKVRSP